MRMARRRAEPRHRLEGLRPGDEPAARRRRGGFRHSFQHARLQRVKAQAGEVEVFRGGRRVQRTQAKVGHSVSWSQKKPHDSSGTVLKPNPGPLCALGRYEFYAQALKCPLDLPQRLGCAPHRRGRFKAPDGGHVHRCTFGEVSLTHVQQSPSGAYLGGINHTSKPLTNYAPYCYILLQ